MKRARVTILGLVSMLLACAGDDGGMGDTGTGSTTSDDTTTTGSDSSTDETTGGGACSSCDNDLCVDDQCAYLVFATAEIFTSPTGVAAADTACFQAAFDAGLMGDYVAWLGTSATPAPNRLEDGRPFALVDGTKIADGVEDLLDGELLAGISLDENGQPPEVNPGCVAGEAAAWTGTLADGTVASENCADWSMPEGGMSGQAGNIGASDSGWTEQCVVGCATMQHFYCFQVGDPGT